MSGNLADTRTGEQDLVVFTVDGVMCALRVDEVQEIKRVTSITNVHRAPSYVRGVVNLRGRIVTVIDLRCKFGYPQCEPSGTSRIVVVERGDEPIGLLVDTIEDAVVAAAEDILPPPSTINGAEGRYFVGVYKTPESLVAILDKEAVLEKEHAADVLTGRA